MYCTGISARDVCQCQSLLAQDRIITKCLSWGWWFCTEIFTDRCGRTSSCGGKKRWFCTRHLDYRQNLLVLGATSLDGGTEINRMAASTCHFCHLLSPGTNKCVTTQKTAEPTMETRRLFLKSIRTSSRKVVDIYLCRSLLLSWAWDHWSTFTEIETHQRLNPVILLRYNCCPQYCRRNSQICFGNISKSSLLPRSYRMLKKKDIRGRRFANGVDVGVWVKI